MYTVRFDHPDGAEMELGAGVAVIETGQLFGGDSGYAYVGPVEVAGDRVSGRLRILRHDPAITSVFGDVDYFELDFDGRRVSDDRIEGELRLADNPLMEPGTFQMERRAELP